MTGHLAGNAFPESIQQHNGPTGTFPPLEPRTALPTRVSHRSFESRFNEIGLGAGESSRKPPSNLSQSPKFARRNSQDRPADRAGSCVATLERRSRARGIRLLIAARRKAVSRDSGNWPAIQSTSPNGATDKNREILLRQAICGRTRQIVRYCKSHACSRGIPG
jgi:hypothetical protein